MKSRPGQGLTEISKKIRLKQNDHASRRTQRSPHTRREQHPVHTRRAQHPTISTPQNPKTRRTARAPRRVSPQAHRLQILRRETFVPSSERFAINPAFVRTNTSTGAVAVVESISPFAPILT